MTEAEPRYSPPEAAAIVTRAYTQAETVGFVLDHRNGIVAAIRSAAVKRRYAAKRSLLTAVRRLKG